MKSDKLIYMLESVAMLVANVYVLITFLGFFLYEFGIGSELTINSVIDCVVAITFISMIKFSRMEKRIKDLEK